METLVLIGSVFGLGFVSGVNLYATVLALGLSVRVGLLHPSPAFEDLAVLSQPVVLWTAAGLYLVEFFADKIPWVDSAWDAVHTFIRPIGAAVLAAVALGDVNPALETSLILMSGGIALTSHTAKASTRVMANATPEPFSNWFLSVTEDVFVFIGALASFIVPVLVLCLVVAFLAGFVWFLPRIVRLLRAAWRRLRAGPRRPAPTGPAEY